MTGIEKGNVSEDFYRKTMNIRPKLPLQKE